MDVLVAVTRTTVVQSDEHNSVVEGYTKEGSPSDTLGVAVVNETEGLSNELSCKFDYVETANIGKLP